MAYTTEDFAAAVGQVKTEAVSQADMRRSEVQSHI